MQFIVQANKHHPSIKFTTEISERETTFLDKTFIKAKDSKAIQFWMCVRTLKILKHFNIRTSRRATHQGVKKRLHQRRGSETSSEQTFLKKYLKSKFKILNHAYAYGKEVIPRLTRGPSQKCNLKTGNWHSFKTKGEQTNLAFRYTIPPSSAKLQTNPPVRLAFNRATTIAQRKPRPSYVTKEGGQSKVYS